MRRPKGKQLQRRRSEVCERSFAHVCDSGGTRRSWLRGLLNVTKRYQIAAAAHNLCRIRRKLFGMGKPKNLQGGFRLAALVQFDMRLACPHRRPALAQAGVGVRITLIPLLGNHSLRNQPEPLSAA